MTRYVYDNKTFRLVRQRTETYNQTDWEFSPDGSVKQDTAYSYDLAGNILGTTENRTNAGFGTTLAGGQGPTPDKLIREFEYDPLYRLILATGREDTSHSHNLIWQDTSPVAPTPANSREYRRSYRYDKMGNILKLAHTAHQASFTRNFGYHTSMQHNKLEEVLDNNQNTLTDFLYDPAGNTIQNNSERFYVWDAANQLKQFKIDDGQTVSVYGQYIYSGGQRVKKLVKDQQGNYTITVYIDGVFEYQKLVKSANTYERNYTHIMDDRSRIATVRAGSDEDDITEDAFYVVEDHLNSSTARLKATDGSVIDREEYYPFGETSLHSFSKKRYRYTGKEKDSESGLYYYGARYYSGWCCRFVSVDPLAAQFADLSPFNYAGNKPVNKVDIDGLQEENRPVTPNNEKVHFLEKSPTIPMQNFDVNQTIPEQPEPTAEKSVPQEKNKPIESTSLAINYGENQTYYFGADNSIPNDPFVRDTVDSLRAIMITDLGTEIIDSVVSNDKIVFEINKHHETDFTVSIYGTEGNMTYSENMSIQFNPSKGIQSANGIEQLPPFLALAHELGHAYRLISALNAGQNVSDFMKENKESPASSEKWPNKEEEMNIKDIEWALSDFFGTLKRQNYSIDYKSTYKFSSPTTLSVGGPDIMRPKSIKPKGLIPDYSNRNIKVK